MRIRKDGTEIRTARKRRTIGLVRIDGEAIPERIVSRILKYDGKRSKELYEQGLRNMVQVVGYDWYIKSEKISPLEAINAVRGRYSRTAESMGEFMEVFANALAADQRDRIIELTIQSLFPLFDGTEQSIAADVIHEYLESREELERLSKEDAKKWVKAHVASHIEGTDIEIEDMSRFIGFMADVQARVLRSWVSHVE